MTRWLGRIVVFVCVLVAGLASAEAFARRMRPNWVLEVPASRMGGLQLSQHDDLLGWVGRPHASGEMAIMGGEGAIPVRLNAWGLRGPLPAPGERPILLIGDSFTAGFDLDDTSTPARQLAERTGRPVFPLAFPGYGTDQTFLLFRRVVVEQKLVEPAEVIYLFYKNDLLENLMTRVYGHNKPYLRPTDDTPGWIAENVPVPKNKRPSLLARSRLAVGIFPDAYTKRDARNRRADDERNELDQFRFLLELLNREVASTGRRLKVLAVPPRDIVYGVAPPAQVRLIEDAVKICEAMDIPVRYPLAAFADHPNRDSLFLGDKTHWTADGTRLGVAEIMVMLDS
ncbi:MAG: hypothetical protein M5R36_08675 [Deltaproteobacteria bacterium]|nr:hypothetical protein [Deltaproteobacteria bacterium]